MKSSLPAIAALVAANTAIASETRQLGAHEHGVGALDIAIDGKTVALEFHAPGADIVGFEYAAKSAHDRATIDQAVATLARPLDLFVLPGAAQCSVAEARAALESDDHADHDGDDHGDEDHGGDMHGDHGDANHDEHEAHAGHSEFHAEYMLTCANPGAISNMTFAYFDTFENARELKVQIVTGAGARAFEVFRADPVLDLRGVF
ncbi:MAG: zinc uptake protein ZrgA [Marinibacterium sp.]